MALYDDCDYPVDDWIAALHEDELASFSTAGTWWTAAQRSAIAVTARRARAAAGVQAGDAAEPACGELPAAARRVAQEVAAGGVGIDRAFCAQAQADGLSEEAYVETVGIVARLAHLDVFARGVGLGPLPLATPTDDGAAPKTRPEAARDEGFFTASVPSAPAGGATAEAIYGNHPAPNILRSLSLVPDEAKRLNRIMDREYCSLEQIFSLTYSPHHSLSRPQVEFIAARVSALNQCFY